MGRGETNLNLNRKNSNLVCMSYLHITRKWFSQATKQVINLEMKLPHFGCVDVHILQSRSGRIGMQCNVYMHINYYIIIT